MRTSKARLQLNIHLCQFVITVFFMKNESFCEPGYCSRVLLNIYLFIYIYYTSNGGKGVRGLGWGVRLGEGRQENKHFMTKQLSLTRVKREMD